MFTSTQEKHRLVTILAALAVFLVSGSAWADRVVWKRTKIDESGGSWKVEVEVHLSKPPDIAHVPMQFKFQPDVYYERSLVDGSSSPQLRKVPLEHKQPLIESVDMGFLDSGSGKIQNRTRFSFRLTRDRGFEAGEYKVTIRNKRSDRNLPPEVRLVLGGENEVIDRRSMVFDTKNSDEKAKKDREAKNAAAEEEFEQRENPDSDEFWSGGPKEAETREEPLPPPAHMQEKPGACGCAVPGAARDGSGLIPWILALGVLLRRRRR